MGVLNARCGNLFDVFSFDPPDVIDVENEFIAKRIEHEQMLIELGQSKSCFH